MGRFLLSSLVQAILSILAVSLIVFFVVRLTGDPTNFMLSEYATKEDHEQLAAELGLDKPWYVQYGIFLKNAVQGDFGVSTRTREPALKLVLERFPATLQLAFAATAFAILIAIPAGVYAATKRGKWLDAAARTFAILGQSMPLFWLGLLLILLFAVQLRWLPSSGMSGWSSLILPAFTMGWYVAAGIMRLTRSSMLDVLDSEYVKMARAKGVPEFIVIWKHAFKNALASILTFSAVLFMVTMSGSVVTETVFAWPGVGRLMIDSVRWRDFPVIQTVVILLAVIFIVGNLLVDMTYAYLNPKIRLNGKS